MGRSETVQPIKLRMDCNKFYSVSTAGNGKRAYGVFVYLSAADVGDVTSWHILFFL
jgi:hypothetical protein